MFESYLTLQCTVLHFDSQHMEYPFMHTLNHISIVAECATSVDYNATENMWKLPVWGWTQIWFLSL